MRGDVGAEIPGRGIGSRGRAGLRSWPPGLGAGGPRSAADPCGAAGRGRAGEPQSGGAPDDGSWESGA